MVCFFYPFTLGLCVKRYDEEIKQADFDYDLHARLTVEAWLCKCKFNGNLQKDMRRVEKDKNIQYSFFKTFPCIIRGMSVSKHMRKYIFYTKMTQHTHTCV